MTKINCVILSTGVSLCVDIGLGQTPAELKRAITSLDPLAFTCATSELTLYHTRGEHNQWLLETHEWIQQLKESIIPEEVKQFIDPSFELDGFFPLDSDTLLGKSVPCSVIHVLVVLPTPTPKSMLDAAVKTKTDYSDHWRRDFGATFFSPDALPAIHSLSALLSEPLRVKIGLTTSAFTRAFSLVTDTVVFEKLFRIDDSHPCRSLWRDGLYGALAPPPGRGTESGFHSFWDACIRTPIDRLFGSRGTSNRGSNRSTSTPIQCPDYHLVLNQVYVSRRRKSTRIRACCAKSRAARQICVDVWHSGALLVRVRDGRLRMRHLRHRIRGWHRCGHGATRFV